MDRLRGRASLIIAVAALVVAGAALLNRAPGAGAAPPRQAAQVPGDQIIRVVGTSQILVTPNEAYVQLGVVNTDKDAQSAISRAGTRGEAALAAIKATGVATDDIHTANAGLLYDPGAKSYQAGTLFTVDLEDEAVSKTGPLIDAAVKAGATKCANVYFALKQGSAPEDQALQEALADAHRRANGIATASGVKITGVNSVDQAVYGYAGPPQYRYGPVPYQNGPTGPIPQPLSCQSPLQGPPGPPTLPLPQISVTANVTVVYNIQ